jgi:hypothetical protein
MGNRFSSGKNSIAECDRCGFRFKLTELRREVVKTKNYELLVCGPCWDPDHPQLQLGMYPVDDPQGVRNPRPDRSYVSSGTTGLQIINGSGPSIDEQGYQGEGSRNLQWGWNPVGGSSFFDDALTPNNLALSVEIGTVTVTTT